MPFSAPANARPNDAPDPRIAGLRPMLCRKEVMSLLGILSRHTLRLMIAQGRFPAPIRINQRLHRWPSDVVRQWYEKNASQTDPTGQPDPFAS